MKTSAREIALLSLCRCEKDGKYSNLEADAAIKKFALEGAEKKLYTKLVYGTTERRITLDYIINALSDGRELSTQMRNILRMSIYQMRYLDRIPDSAAVNEGVELAKKYERLNAASYANAILRKYLRDADKIRFPQKKDGIVEYLCVNYSVSEDVCRCLISSIGEEESEKLLSASFDVEHYITLRVNTLKTTVQRLLEKLSSHGIAAAPTRLSPFGINIHQHIQAPALLELVEASAFIEDEASQCAICALDAAAGMTVVDTCAAPGGKSVSAAIQMENGGEVYAFDLHKNKLSLIEKSAAAMGVTIIKTAEHNGKAPLAQLISRADRVICDVPCSGIGTIYKKPDLRYKDMTTASQLIRTQYEILCASSRYLKPGGLLVYSTCTLNGAENTQQIESFMSEHDGFTLLSETTLLQHIHGTDGFYIAVLKRTDA